MKPEPINLQEKLRKISQLWTPKVVAQMNDYHFKLVKFQGEFVWHEHSDTDEVFVVIGGEMKIHFRDHDVSLRQGELFVIPRGVQHKTSAVAECHALLVESAGTLNTGDVRSGQTAPVDDWI